MSWIKPNFLWMMYRSGWGTKPGQEVTLAVTLRRDFFDSLLMRAVPSSYTDLYACRDDWKRAIGQSDVRLQWDPDRDPTGAPLARRAIQVGLRRKALAGWNGDDLVAVRDISPFVAAQRQNAVESRADLFVPAERAYPIEDPVIRKRIGLASPMAD